MTQTMHVAKAVSKYYEKYYTLSIVACIYCILRVYRTYIVKSGIFLYIYIGRFVMVPQCMCIW